MFKILYRIIPEWNGVCINVWRNLQCKKRFDEIWRIDDINTFIVELDNWLGEKCNYGESLKMLSACEKVFYLNQMFEREVNNGGLAQFLYNSGDGFNAVEVENSLREIGANTTAANYKKMLDAFGCELPKAQAEREELLDRIIDDKLNSMIDEFNSEFCLYHDDLNALNYQYVMNNRAQFGCKS